MGSHDADAVAAEKNCAKLMKSTKWQSEVGKSKMKFEADQAAEWN